MSTQRIITLPQLFAPCYVNRQKAPRLVIQRHELHARIDIGAADFPSFPYGSATASATSTRVGFWEQFHEPQEKTPSSLAESVASDDRDRGRDYPPHLKARRRFGAPPRFLAFRQLA